MPIRLELAEADKADLRADPRPARALPIRRTGARCRRSCANGGHQPRDTAIYHKDLLPVVYVTGDMAGRTDSPLYGHVRDLGSSELTRCDDSSWSSASSSQPGNPYEYSLKWDGEWQVTYETFRDMGLAYAVGLVLIYLLVVAQFRSYLVPLIIMAPIPLTIIGIMPGHALLRCAVHRDLHDRHDRARRHHRAQLHPAGGLHPPASARGHEPLQEAVIRRQRCGPSPLR